MRAKPPAITRHSATHRSIHTEIDIDAPADLVWDTLTEGNTMPDWSTTYQGFIGKIGLNSSIVLKVRAFGRVLSIDHVLTHYEPKRVLGWSERAMPGIVDNHQFVVQPVTDHKTRFLQTDEFRGWGVPLHGRLTLRQVNTLYPRFNEELKAEAERRSTNQAE